MRRGSKIGLGLVVLVGLLSVGAVGAAGSSLRQQHAATNRFGVDIKDASYGTLRDWMIQMLASEEENAALAAAAQVPAPESVEFINPLQGAGEVVQPDFLTPLLTVTAELVIPNVAELSAPGGPLAPGPGPAGTVFYSPGVTAPSGERWYMYAKTFAASPCSPSGIREYGVVGYDPTPLNGGSADRYTEASTSNLFYGNNFAYVLHSDPQNPDFAPVRYQFGVAGPQPAFNVTDSQWLGVCFNDTVIGLIPADEWEGTTDLRLFGYSIPIRDGEAQSADAAQMRVPGVALDPQSAVDLVEITLGESGPTTEPTEPATQEPTGIATPQPTAPQTSSPTASSPTGQPAPSASASTSSTTLPYVTPTPGAGVPGAPAPAVDPGGIDPLIVIFLLGLGLIGFAIILFVVADRERSL